MNPLEQLPDNLRQHDTLVMHWCLRALLDLDLLERTAKKQGDHIDIGLDDELLELMGINTKNLPSGFTHADLRQHLEQLRNNLPETNPTGHPLWNSVQTLADSLYLNAMEREVLMFTGILKSSANLSRLMEYIDPINDIHDAAKIIATLLQQEEECVQAALSPRKRLLDTQQPTTLTEDFFEPLFFPVQFSLLDVFKEAVSAKPNIFSTEIENIDKKHKKTKKSKREYMDEHGYYRDEKTINPISTQVIGNAKYSKNIKGCFGHQYNKIHDYLKNSIQNAKSGINVLLEDWTGFGGIELIKTLAEDLGMNLHKLSFASDYDFFAHSCKRTDSYSGIQRSLSAESNPLLLVESVSDLELEISGYNSSLFFRNAMQSNTVPTIWMIQSQHPWHPAIAENCSFFMTLSSINILARRRLLQSAVADLNVSPNWLKRIAASDYLTLSNLERAARAARTSGLQGKAAEALMSDQITAMQQACGMTLKKPAPDYRSDTRYQPEFSNTDQNLDDILQALKRSGEGRLCLYGPPGTGKTGFAYHLGEYLKKPVLAKPASQLLGMYVGESEKNIARAFREANAQNAILLLDEADSLIYSREGHHHSWETTQVNELLMQMERFRGILVASTNLLERVDSAAMRRFDFKIRFDYLQPEQAEALFQQILNPQGQRRNNNQQAVTAQHLARLKTIQPLSPACFAVAARQARILGQPLTPDSLLEALQRESTLIEGCSRHRPVGFVH